MQEFKVAMPRLFLAILLALVISKPLELKIFEKEINRKIDQKRTELDSIAIAGVTNNFSQIGIYEMKITALNNEIIRKENYRNQLQREYDFERFGKKTPGTTGIPGIGTNAQKKESQLNQSVSDLQQTLNRNQPQITKFNREINKLEGLKQIAIANQKPNIDNYDGLAARIDALGALSSESSAMNLANLFLILLFIAIETSPIFTKLISSKGPYDDLLEKHEHSIEIYKIEQMSKNNQKTNERLEIVIQSGNNAVTEELEGNRNLMKLIVEAETELAQEMINQWKEDEMGKIKNGKTKKK